MLKAVLVLAAGLDLLREMQDTQCFSRRVLLLGFDQNLTEGTQCRPDCASASLGVPDVNR